MSDAPTSTPKRWLRALWGGLLSLILPGLGQVYAGWWRLGIGLFIGAIILDLLFLGLTWSVPPTPAMAATAACVMLGFRIVVAGDAVRRVRSMDIPQPRPWYRSTWLTGIAMIAVGAAAQAGFREGSSTGWRSFHIASGSILPTLAPGEYVLTDARLPGTLPGYGDMVVFRHPKNPTVDIIKRVVGLPGDRVQLRDGILVLNGKPVPRESDGYAAVRDRGRDITARRFREMLPDGRSYVIMEKSGSRPANTEEFIVPAAAFFVLGDNRNDSIDSRFQREFGYVPVANVIGIVGTVFWSDDPARLLARVR